MILSASRTLEKKLPKPKSGPARAGLWYQARFSKAFGLSIPDGFIVETNPWFSYFDSSSRKESICSPDLIAIDTENEFVVVVEVKTTWTPLALEKLNSLYCPVVSRAFGLPTTPLVVCRILTPESPRPQTTVSFALLSQEPLIHWPNQGPILW